MLTREETLCRLTSIVTLIWLLSFPVCAEEPVHGTVQLRIEAVGANESYDGDSSIPIRCRFTNTSDKPVSLVLPGLGSRRIGITSLGLTLIVKRENEKAPLFHRRSDFKSEFCRSVSEKMDSNIECDSPRDIVDLPPHQEFVRTVHLATLLSDVGKTGWRIGPGKYIVQISSRQAGGILMSNELAIQVKP